MSSLFHLLNKFYLNNSLQSFIFVVSQYFFILFTHFIYPTVAYPETFRRHYIGLGAQTKCPN